MGQLHRPLLQHVGRDGHLAASRGHNPRPLLGNGFPGRGGADVEGYEPECKHKDEQEGDEVSRPAREQEIGEYKSRPEQQQVNHDVGARHAGGGGRKAGTCGELKRGHFRQPIATQKRGSHSQFTDGHTG